MNAATEDREEPIEASLPVRAVEVVGMTRCKRCNLLYTATKSTSALRLTYCSFLCELGDLGFSMAGLEHMERVPRPEAVAVEPEPEPAIAAAD